MFLSAKYDSVLDVTLHRIKVENKGNDRQKCDVRFWTIISLRILEIDRDISKNEKIT